jgi:hypothetical protein
MALGSTQVLTEMSTGDLPWAVKVADAYGWQPYYLFAACRESWDSQPPGTLGGYLGLYRDRFVFLLKQMQWAGRRLLKF